MKKIKQETISFETLIFLFVLFFFMATTIFDITVTLTMFSINPIFMNYEANDFFMWGINKNIPMPLNPTLLIHYGLFITYIQSYLKRKISERWRIAFCSLTCSLIALSGVHLIGGASWLYSNQS